MKILILDDHVGLREGIKAVLKDFEVLCSATIEEALAMLKDNKDCQLMILDLNLNKKISLSYISSFRKLIPEIRILVYTMYSDPLHIEEALTENVQGYITKDTDVDELEKAVKTILDGGLYFNEEALQIMQNLISGKTSKPKTKSTKLFDQYKILTPKEQEVFSLLVHGCDVYEISKQLNKSIKTVNNQKSIIYQKLNLHDKLDVMNAAKTLGLIIWKA